jgi:Ca2+-binding RTX toxin-like protein
MADITGTMGPDTLDGTSGDDLILGLDGNDVLNGLGGADRLEGGIGNDTFLLDDPNDVVIENASAGVDVLYSLVSYALAAGQEVEVLSLYQTRTDAINLTGNEFAQTLIGSAGNNILTGGGGADVFYGLAGNDTYVVDSADDVVIEGAGAGSDTVSASVSYVLMAGQSIENLRITDKNSTGDLWLTGNEVNQQIFGNAGNNVLIGGTSEFGSSDRLTGYGGNDTYMVDSSSSRKAGMADWWFYGDIAYEDKNGGSDAVYTKNGYELYYTAEIEVLSAYDQHGTDPITLIGNLYQQTIVGNDGDNLIDGGHASGAETGGVQAYDAGPDILYGRGGTDTFRFSAGYQSGFDIVLDYVPGTDKITLVESMFRDFTSGAPSVQLGALGALSPDVFVQGTAALDSNDRLLYDQASGKLFFDPDANGAKVPVLFALFDNHPTLTAADFTLVAPIS